jgi:alpha-L-rhamnosidase
MKNLGFILLLVIYGGAVFGQPPGAAVHLRCDLLLHTDAVSKNGLPAAVSLQEAAAKKELYQFAQVVSEKPAFSWEVDAPASGISAYRVIVASSPELLGMDKGDYWDSKKVNSKNTHAGYNGKPLDAGKVYYWKVRIWDSKGMPAPFSERASFVYMQSTAQAFSYQPLAAEIQKPVAMHQTGKDAYFVDFGKDALGQLQLHLNSAKDDTVWVEAGEAIDKPYSINSNPGRNIRYLKIPLAVKKGTHDYQITLPENVKRNSRNPVLMPDYIGEVFAFRYVSIQNYKEKLTPSDIQRKIIFYPFDSLASAFSSSDTVLNRVWDLCKYSIKATSFTGYYVDGDRERIPYEADALINQLSHYAVDAEYSMARRTMDYLIYHPTWPKEWSLQNVLIAWTDYMYTGDDLLIRKYYPDLQKKVLSELAGANGLISTRTDKQTDAFLASIHMTKKFDGRRGLHDNVDWPQTGNYIGDEKEFGGETDGFVYNTYNAVVNAYYYRSLLLMQRIALALKKDKDAKYYEVKARQVYDSFHSVFHDEETGLIKDGDSTRHSSLHASMFALAFGLVREENQEKVVKFIKSRGMACSVYGAQFLLDALYESGQGQYALQLMTATTQRSWYNMIRSGSTITMEAWDKVYKPNLDLNHAWGAAPANIIVRQLMGVQPVSPGFGHFQIKPQWGGLTFANLETPTIKGRISVRYESDAARDQMEVVVPGGASADIFVPSRTEKPRLLMNGKQIFSKPQNGFFVFKNLPAGKYKWIMN